jgi:hypothetical protein
LGHRETDTHFAEELGRREIASHFAEELGRKEIDTGRNRIKFPGPNCSETYLPLSQVIELVALGPASAG